MPQSLEWINPYDQAFAKGLPQVRSNFHTHAGQIDKCAVNTLQDTESLYSKLGYSLLAISNHNRFTPMQHLNSPDQALQYLDAYEQTVTQHILCLGIAWTFDLEMPYQQIIDETSKLGGFSILCHPNWIREDFWPDSMLMETEAPDAKCPLPEGEGYVRVQVISEEGAMLWTQPVYTAGWFNR